MDPHANTDYYSLTDEKFDFDVSLSPASSRGDEEEDDEVFVGPVCVSAGREAEGQDGVGTKEPCWSPLTGDKMEAICREAQQLASQLEGSQQNSLGRQETSQDHVRDVFVQDTVAKLGMFSQPADAVLSPIKRETFCVQDSPMKQLPPAIQQRLLKGNGSVNSRVVAPSKARLSTSSPVRGAKPQPKVPLRGKAGLGFGVVLPSKPAALPTSSTLNAAKTRATPAERTSRLPPPSRAALGLRCSPARQSSSRAGSCEDLLSDSASVASDVSDSSLNSSLLGQRALAPPSKTGLRNPSAVKAPPPLTRRAVDRRNTSSSSSSVSSFNSSLSVSPGKGKHNSSLNSSITGPSSRTSTSLSNLASSSTNTTKTQRPVSGKGPQASGAVEASSAARARHSLLAQARKTSEADWSKATRPTPIKTAEPDFLTPAKRVMERSCSVPRMPSSSTTAKPQPGVKAIPKRKALIAPTPTGQIRGPRGSDVSSPDPLRIMKPKRLMSACSVDSLPQKLAAPELLLTPSAGGNKSLQCKMRRPSALPTPVSRRTSSIPTMTPRSLAPPGRPSPRTSNLPASARRPSSCSGLTSPAQLEKEHLYLPDIQPFSLEDNPPDAPQSHIPGEAASPCDAGQGDQGNQGDQGDQEPRNLIELHSTEDQDAQHHDTKTQEVLLVDVPAPLLMPEEKLLIDLSNTPDLIRTSGKPCGGGQLIDLSSPLIKWSPEDKKENVTEAPLINLSF